MITGIQIKLLHKNRTYAVGDVSYGKNGHEQPASLMETYQTGKAQTYQRARYRHCREKHGKYRHKTVLRHSIPVARLDLQETYVPSSVKPYVNAAEYDERQAGYQMPYAQRRLDSSIIVAQGCVEPYSAGDCNEK